MRRRSAAMRAVLLLAGAAIFAAGIAVAATTTVVMTPTGPQPLTATVNWGDTLDFVNSDSSPHVLASTATEIGTTTVQPGQTLPVTFTGQTGLKRYTMSGKPRNFIFPAVTVTLHGTINLTARSQVVTYGSSTALVGHLDLTPDATVSLQQRPLNQFQNGTGEWQPVGSPMPIDSSGAFTYPITPKAGIEYEAVAAAGQLLSEPVKVSVTPAITVVAPRKVSAGVTFTIHVAVHPATAAGSVGLESYVPKLKAWHSLGRAHLVHGRGKLLTAVGAGRTRFRISIDSHDLAGAGFASSDSKPFTVLAR